MAKRWVFAVLFTLGFAGVGAVALGANEARPANEQAGQTTATAAQVEFQGSFNVDKATLLDKGSNTYMILEPSYKLTLADGKDTLTITVLDETKMVDGVRTRVMEERETKDGKLAEVSRNYFAFDKATGDIYYFGEDVNVYDAQGYITSHEGSWQSGVDGAQFGLMMPGKPKVGRRYQQEVAPRVAMDRAEVISLTEKVTVPAGTFENCLKTRESSALEKGVEEKLFAPGVGLLKDGGFKLAKIEKPPIKLPEPVTKAFQTAFPKARITKLDMEEEDGVTVYDFEFKDGGVEKETDIAADGTMLEFTVVIPAVQMPAAALKAVRAAAEGGELGRVERIEISHETQDGKIVKLDKPKTQYAVEITKGDKTSEIVVDPEGAVIESGED
jgi:uncharacterized membrane protein YkoI